MRKLHHKTPVISLETNFRYSINISQNKRVLTDNTVLAYEVENILARFSKSSNTIF
jgi:hypothetical protein